MGDVHWLRVASFVLAVVAGWLVTGALKRAGRLPCDLARKANHILALAGGALWLGWLPRDAARASVFVTCGVLLVLVVVVCALRNRPGFRLAFAANTRESDAPHQGFYFWGSWLVSVVGLGGVELVWDDIVVTRTAALVVGLADGVAEPIGRRLGRHRYHVVSFFRGKPAGRSVEGSAAVLVTCFLTLVGCFAFNSPVRLPEVLAGCLAVAAAVTLVEAVSPSGLDNLTIPVATAALLRPLDLVT
jgi:phytol kinase